MDQFLVEIFKSQGVTGFLLAYVIYSFERYNKNIGEDVAAIKNMVEKRCPRE